MFRKLKFWWQRKTRGFSNEDLWNLDITIAEFVLPRLKVFRGCCSPDMEKHVEDMIAAFKIILSADGELLSLSTKDQIVVKRGLNKFAKYYRGLWC
jgi:hypothetical protein